MFFRASEYKAGMPGMNVTLVPVVIAAQWLIEFLTHSLTPSMFLRQIFGKRYAMISLRVDRLSDRAEQDEFVAQLIELVVPNAGR